MMALRSIELIKLLLKGGQTTCWVLCTTQKGTFQIPEHYVFFLHEFKIQGQ